MTKPKTEEVDKKSAGSNESVEVPVNGSSDPVDSPTKMKKAAKTESVSRRLRSTRTTTVANNDNKNEVTAANEESNEVKAEQANVTNEVKAAQASVTNGVANNNDNGQVDDDVQKVVVEANGTSDGSVASTSDDANGPAVASTSDDANGPAVASTSDDVNGTPINGNFQCEIEMEDDDLVPRKKRRFSRFIPIPNIFKRLLE